MDIPIGIAAGLALTVLAYATARMLHVGLASPATVPVLVATGLVLAARTLFDVDYATYRAANAPILSALPAATVALAVPFFRHRSVLRRHALAVGIGCLTGTAVTLFTALLVSAAAGLPASVVASISVKSVTTAIAIGIAPILGGDPTLTAVLVVSAGLLGAVFGTFLLDCIGVTDPVARGVAVGTVSHAIGTAQIVQDSELAGAVSGVAMVIAALTTAALAPSMITVLIAAVRVH